MRYLNALLGECVARGSYRLLIEERLEGPRLRTLDVFEIVSTGSRRALGMLTALAYVDIHAEGELMHFAETAVMNRGVPIMIFPDVAEAEKWLLGASHKAAKPEAGST